MTDSSALECGRCGATNPTIANFCRQCGAPVSSRGARPTTPPTPLLQQWRRLKFRMTRKEVRTILGEPARIECLPIGASCSDANTTAKERWFFDYTCSLVPQPASSRSSPQAGIPSRELLRGIVEFASPDGTVASWSEPDWSFLDPA